MEKLIAELLDSFRFTFQYQIMNMNPEDLDIKKIAFTGAALAVGAFAATRFKVAGANQTLIRYGLGYGNKIKPAQSGFVWPGQQYRMINMEPTQTRMTVSCNSKELIPFNLPVVISTQPVDWRTDIDGFINYCKTYADADADEMCGHMEDLLAGDIRTSASALGVADMIAKKRDIYEQLEEPVYDILRSVGIHTQKCNIEEVEDILKGGGYIDELRKKAIAAAQNTAEKDVKESEMDKRMKVAEFEKNAVLEENKNKELQAHSRAQLEEARAEEKKRSEIAHIEAGVAAKRREAELEKEFFEKKQEAETERIRMEQYVKANIEADARVREAKGIGDSERSKAQGNADAVRTRAEAERFDQEQQAQAERFRQEQLAEARRFEQEQIAEGKLVADLKEAEGTFAKYKAKADGIREVNSAADENPELAQFQMALEKNLPQELAHAAADAVRDMKPTVWYTGSGDSADPFQSIMGGVQKVAPFLQTMSEQSGMDVSRLFPKHNGTLQNAK